MIKTKNIQLCQIKEKSFKKDRIEIVDFIKINRKSQYQKFFEEKIIPKLYGKGFIISYILKKEIELIHPLHCL